MHAHARATRAAANIEGGGAALRSHSSSTHDVMAETRTCACACCCVEKTPAGVFPGVATPSHFKRVWHGYTRLHFPQQPSRVALGDAQRPSMLASKRGETGLSQWERGQDRIFTVA